LTATGEYVNSHLNSNFWGTLRLRSKQTDSEHWATQLEQSRRQERLTLSPFNTLPLDSCNQTIKQNNNMYYNRQCQWYATNGPRFGFGLRNVYRYVTGFELNWAASK
jgi:hypothetical protein